MDAVTGGLEKKHFNSQQPSLAPFHLPACLSRPRASRGDTGALWIVLHQAGALAGSSDGGGYHAVLLLIRRACADARDKWAAIAARGGLILRPDRVKDSLEREAVTSGENNNSGDTNYVCHIPYADWKVCEMFVCVCVCLSVCVYVCVCVCVFDSGVPRLKHSGPKPRMFFNS